MDKTIVDEGVNVTERVYSPAEVSAMMDQRILGCSSVELAPIDCY